MIEPLLQAPSKPGRHRTVALRAVFDAIQYMLATEVPMAGDTQVFPAFTAVQNYLYAWRDLGDEEAELPPKVA